MTATVCTVDGCDREVRDAYLCRDCTARLRRDLRHLPDLIAEIEVALTRQTNMGADNAGKIQGSPSPPLMFGLRASELGPVVRDTVHTWALHIGAERGIGIWMALPPGSIGPTCQLCEHRSCAAIRRRMRGVAVTYGRLATWMLDHVEWIRHHRHGAMLAEEIRYARTIAHSIIDRPATRTRFPVGPCPEAGCDGTIEARIPTAEGDPALLICDTCEMRAETHQWLRLGKRIVELIEKRRAAA